MLSPRALGGSTPSSQGRFVLTTCERALHAARARARSLRPSVVAAGCINSERALSTTRARFPLFARFQRCCGCAWGATSDEVFQGFHQGVGEMCPKSEGGRPQFGWKRPSRARIWRRIGATGTTTRSRASRAETAEPSPALDLKIRARSTKWYKWHRFSSRHSEAWMALEIRLFWSFGSSRIRRS